MLLPDTISRLAFARAEQKIKPAPGATVKPPAPPIRNASDQQAYDKAMALTRRADGSNNTAADYQVHAPTGVAAARG